jgi:2-(1,2-epoxy-1,2-dihydrophenyl)acetyl-CoA isomerase
MRTDFERVYVVAHDRVALLALNDPHVLNAISTPMIGGAMAALDHIEASGFRALVITGEGRGFCAGANLAEGLAEGATDAPSTIAIRMDQGYHPLLRRLRDFPVPIVTAVNGAAIGIGLSFALMGDLVAAGNTAYFQHSFARIGLVPDGGSTWLLPRLIGLARARELSMLAERLSAEQALAWGLINRVFGDERLMPEALALAARLAEGPSVALSAMRRMYWQSPHNTYEQQLEVERENQLRAGSTQDFIEGVRAFLEKRKPAFKGQ